MIFTSIAREKKRDVQKIINDSSLCSVDYSLIWVFFRSSQASDELRFKQQISFWIFQLFIFSSLLEIMINNTNIKIDLERSKVSHEQRDWHNITNAEIEAFLRILLYMNCVVLSRIRDYWNTTNLNRVVYDLMFSSMSIKRWEQIRRYLKTFNLLENEKIDTRESDWWKKLESLTSEFRKISKTYWLFDHHVSVDEQLVKFKKRSRHIMQITSKATEVEFKLYNLC